MVERRIQYLTGLESLITFEDPPGTSHIFLIEAYPLKFNMFWVRLVELERLEKSRAMKSYLRECWSNRIYCSSILSFMPALVLSVAERVDLSNPELLHLNFGGSLLNEYPKLNLEQLTGNPNTVVH